MNIISDDIAGKGGLRDGVAFRDPTAMTVDGDGCRLEAGRLENHASDRYARRRARRGDKVG